MTLKHLFSYYYTLQDIQIRPITSPLLPTTGNGQRTNLAQFSMVCSKCRVSNTVSTHYQLNFFYQVIQLSFVFPATPLKLNAETKCLKDDLAQLTLEFISAVSRDHLIFKFLDVKRSHHTTTQIAHDSHMLPVSTDNLAGIYPTVRFT